MRPARERAARALCQLHGVPEETRFEGGAMWRSYLPEVDAVLQAALSHEAWADLLADETKKPAPGEGGGPDG